MYLRSHQHKHTRPDHGLCYLLPGGSESHAHRCLAVYSRPSTSAHPVPETAVVLVHTADRIDMASSMDARPGLFWVVSYDHLSSRSVEKGIRERRVLPLTPWMLQRFQDAGLLARIRPSDDLRGDRWWVGGQSSSIGPCLHSLVLAQPGHDRAGAFDDEEQTIGAYFRCPICTLKARWVNACVEPLSVLEAGGLEDSSLFLTAEVQSA